MKRGAFILLEGVDRSGKSTQTRKLVEMLTKDGIQAKWYGFPNRTTTIGKQINQYLQNKAEIEDHCIHLLFSANRWEAKNSILADLREGITVVCDRYFASGVAFSAAKGLDMSWCLSPDKGLPSPDIVLFLDVDEEEQSTRGGFGEERYEISSFQRKVREKFFELHTMLPELRWKTVNARGTIDEVYHTLRKEVDSTINEVQDKPVSFLYLSLFNKQ